MGIQAAGWAIAIGGAAYSADRADSRAEDTLEAQKEAQDVERSIGASRATRARRKTISEAIRERARVENVAGATGMEGTAVSTAGTSASAKAASNVMNINTGVSQSEQMFKAKSNLMKVGNKGPGVAETVVTGAATQFGKAAVGSTAESIFRDQSPTE